jgi:hypothetical protein
MIVLRKNVKEKVKKRSIKKRGKITKAKSGY